MKTYKIIVSLSAYHSLTLLWLASAC